MAWEVNRNDPRLGRKERCQFGKRMRRSASPMDQQNDRTFAPFLNMEIDATCPDHPALAAMGPMGGNGQG
jgi:hypothetical protein